MRSKVLSQQTVIYCDTTDEGVVRAHLNTWTGDGHMTTCYHSHGM